MSKIYSLGGSGEGFGVRLLSRIGVEPRERILGSKCLPKCGVLETDEQGESAPRSLSDGRIAPGVQTCKCFF